MGVRYKCSAHGVVARDVASCAKGPVFDSRDCLCFSLHTGARSEDYKFRPQVVFFYFFYFLIVCFTSYLVFSCIAVLPHSAGVVYYHLLLRRETRIPGVAPFSFRIGIWDLFVHRGQKSYTPTAFGKLWTTPGVRCMQHASS